MGDYNKLKVAMLIILCLFSGIALGLLISVYYNTHKESEMNREELREKGYKFISPLIDYEEPCVLRHRAIIKMKDDIERFIDTKLKEGNVFYIAVYFRDLFNGPWFGINEAEEFEPASLLKVPLMIAYLKIAEENPGILDYKLKYEKEITDGVAQNIMPDKELELGKYYTIDDLLYRMIVYSDNIAKDILMLNMDSKFENKIYNDLGIAIKFLSPETGVITIKEYASLFRILFNAAYLDREMSEKALEILSKSSFKIGIRAGVPPGVTVASKFGERGNETNNTFQLHDCGIVYHKVKPYILCVMTYGRRFKDDVNVIREISTIVYKGVEDYCAPGLKK